MRFDAAFSVYTGELQSMDYKKEIESKKELEETVLGREICLTVTDNDMILDERKIEREISVLEKIYEETLLNTKDWTQYGSEGVFSNFFGFFGKIAVEYAEVSSMPQLNNPEKNLLSNLYSAIFWIPLRVLIQDIHDKKGRGMLKGTTSEEEYTDYQSNFLMDGAYIKKICDDFPEIKQLIFRQIIMVVREIYRILQAVERDKKTLVQELCHGRTFLKIDSIKCGMSDVHNRGQAVAKVCLDNQYILMYKPKELHKDKLFFQLYSNFCEKAELPWREVSILACENYGWEEYINYEECKNQDELERYFGRMGILLFLSYLLDVSNMHGENIIASGEYPVPIALETVPGYKPYSINETAEQKINDAVRHSVLSTGILPVYFWSDKVILSAFHKGDSIQSLLKHPVVCRPGTSEIHIEYRQGDGKILSSLPVYCGKAANPALYRQAICHGFQRAYMLFLQNKDKYMDIIEGLFSGKSRYLVRHTQQYQMYLQSSYFPELLESFEKRRLFLHVLDRNTPVPSLLQYERNSLLQMDIPVFYIYGNKTALSDGQGNEYPGYLERTPKDNWLKKIENICMQDMDLQLSFIECSLEMLKERRYMSRKYSHQHLERAASGFKERAKRQIDAIAAQICCSAFISRNDDISFCIPHVKNTYSCSFDSSGMYLYDGLGGIAVFLATVLKESRCELYAYILRVIVGKLFQHTENIGKSDKLKAIGADVFDGEGSLITVYLILYLITGNGIFLKYAKMQAEIVEQFWCAETCMDYLSGLSGAIVVYGKLYKLTGETIYLDHAVMMGEEVWRNCEMLESEAGWRIKRNVPPLAGLSHGNSGLLLACGVLLENTGNKIYQKRIDRLLIYEDSLLVNGNWKDLRQPRGNRVCNNTWCHGAVGILLSRLQLKKAGFFDKAVERDIEYCKQIFLEEREADALCLCHGLSGYYMALWYFLKDYPDAELEQEMRRLGWRILMQIEGKQFSALEKYNSSLMTGLSGIGIALYCAEQYENKKEKG